MKNVINVSFKIRTNVWCKTFHELFHTSYSNQIIKQAILLFKLTLQGIVLTIYRKVFNAKSIL